MIRFINLLIYNFKNNYNNNRPVIWNLVSIWARSKAQWSVPTFQAKVSLNEKRKELVDGINTEFMTLTKVEQDNFKLKKEVKDLKNKLTIAESKTFIKFKGLK